MSDVVNPKSASPDQLLPYYKKISANAKALMIRFNNYTFMVLKTPSYARGEREIFSSKQITSYAKMMTVSQPLADQLSLNEYIDPFTGESIKKGKK